MYVCSMQRCHGEEQEVPGRVTRSDKVEPQQSHRAREGEEDHPRPEQGTASWPDYNVYMYVCISACARISLYSTLWNRSSDHSGFGKVSFKVQLTHEYLIILAGTTLYCVFFIQYPYILHSRNVMKWFCILTMCSYFLRSIFFIWPVYLLLTRVIGTYYIYWTPTTSTIPSRS